jgi:fimbrial isopeptide formation D2 family protein/uncharacterized repeat protein (TIGR01451 family)/LPXTG-motif cell wall-anchored protein
MLVFAALSTLMLVGLPVTAAVPASAQEPVYEITGSWIDPPETIVSGTPVTSEWRVNVNDAENPPSNEPVDNVTATFTVENGAFEEIPDVCLTEGVDPPSSISEDKRTLTCNFGTVNMGTALVLQTPVIADGPTGSELSMSGSIGGQTVDLDPIEIQNQFGMDITWESPTNWRIWPADDTVDIDFQWTLNLLKGSEPGPDSVSYTLTLDPSVGGPTSGLACEPFAYNQASGHPWSGGNHPADQEAPFVDSCTLTPTGSPNQYTLTLTGIDYSLAQVPTKDSGGNALPVDRSAIASGRVVFRLPGATQSGSVGLESSAPTYTSADGQTSTDAAANNAVSKTFTLPGGWASAWLRGHSGQGGTNWDDTYRASPGTELRADNHSELFTVPANAGQQMQQCTVLDSAYTTLAKAPSFFDAHTGKQWEAGDDPAITVYYYVGNDPSVTAGSGSYNPEVFVDDCDRDAGNWTTQLPADLSTVKAVRAVYNADDVQQYRSILMLTDQTINLGVAAGQDIWQFSSYRVGTNPWTYNVSENAAITPTPNARFPYTTAWRDIVRVVTVQPFVKKAVDQTSVRVGEPANYTLTYSANGGAAAPKTVDDYVLTDTLPVGLEYVPGSADPEPTVTIDDQGRQVLTWTLDDVTTNTEHELKYQAVANEDAEPGQRLENVVQASVEGSTSGPARAAVTVSTNGYTTILKTSDVKYIPNDAGDGVGTGSWTVTIESFDPLPQAFTDTIDILPYNGDGRGTSFSGSYTLNDMVVPDGATVYYTDADPSTLVDDPAHASNGAAGDPAGNTVGWSTTRPDSPTAIRVIGPELAPGGSFSFQVGITTDGAKLGDVYVNRAQARAEHTELVMRTSAALKVTDYLVEKTSDPASGSVVAPGDKVTYTVTVTQQGDVPAGAVFTDDLSDVFDEATYNDDVKADIGEASLEDDLLSWKGEIPVGKKATITYSVTVNDTDEPSELFLKNVVTSPGCYSPAKCTTQHPGAGRYEVSKTSDPAPGSKVVPGDKVTYQVQIVQRGRGPANGASITDDLSDVLDDAKWNGDLKASVGKAALDGSTLTWTGDLRVGDKVTLTYSVTYTGDGKLHNLVTPGEGGTCVPAPDGNPDCQTEHTPAPGLPRTGADGLFWLIAGGLVPLLLAGLVVAYTRRRATR